MRLPIVFHLRRDTSTRCRRKGPIGTSGLIPPVDIRCDYFLAIDHQDTDEIELHGKRVHGFAELTFMDGVIAPLSCRDAGSDGTVTTMAALKAGDFFTCGGTRAAGR